MSALLGRPAFFYGIVLFVTVWVLLNVFAPLCAVAPFVSNNSPPPLMVIMTPFGSMTPWSKGMCILQRYIEFLH